MNEQAAAQQVSSMDNLTPEDVIGSTRQLLTFTVGEEEYSVDIMMVREIKAWVETTRLPKLPEYMRGVINLRGIIIPIFDLRARFDMGMTEASDKHVVIILAVGSRLIGILVDTVSDILTIGNDAVRPVPESYGNIDAAFVDGLISVNERMVVLLNVEQLFSGKAIDQVVKEAVSA